MILTFVLVMLNICEQIKLLYTKFYCHIHKSEKLFGLGLFSCEYESKSCECKACEHNSNFYDYEVLTVNTNSSFWVRVEKC